MRSYSIFVLLTFCLVTEGCANRGPEPDGLSLNQQLKVGDLIFLDLDCGELCDAIETVTLEQFEVKGPRLSHIGAVSRKTLHETYVIEAWPVGGVREVSLKDFLARVKAGENHANGYYLGHFKASYRAKAVNSVKAMKKLIGLRYDEVFLIQNKKYYCSELIADGFMPLFQLKPMYFGKPDSHDYKVWKDYYEKQKMSVPSGKPGLSPLGIYLEGREKYFD